MKLVLDAGALIAVERNDRRVAALIKLGRRAGAELVSTSPVLAQAWRNGARQAQLARALPMIDVRPVAVDEARSAGELLASTNTSRRVARLVRCVALTLKAARNMALRSLNNQISPADPVNESAGQCPRRKFGTYTGVAVT